MTSSLHEVRSHSPFTSPPLARHNEPGRPGIVKLCVLASSSSGNATFLAAGRTRLLIDAGLSRREILNRLTAIGEDPASLDAILITHEHSDHVSGLVALARLLGIPVYLTSLTAPGIAWGDFTPNLETFQAGQSFSIGDIAVTSFTVPHDAADPVGFCFRAEGLRIGIATDLGYLPESVRYHLRGADFLLLESNHDIEMLKVGPYPWAVKQRVMGRNGHLSNDVACDYIRDSLDSATTTLVLGHLSAHNNHPALVEQAASQALAAGGRAARLVVAEPGVQSEVFQF